MIAAPPPPTPAHGAPLVSSASPPPGRAYVPPRELAPTVLTPARRTARRLGRIGVMLGTVVVATVAALGIHSRMAATPSVFAPIRLGPTPVFATLRLEGALVRGAARDWALNRKRPARYGEPMPVQLTAYCLKGTTRRDNYVRQGIVAADPQVFPLGRYIDLYIGRVYHGRFLVDDTGSAIQDAILDIWTPECSDARRFGRQRGIAVLVPRPRGASKDTLLTGRLGGLKAR